MDNEVSQTNNSWNTTQSVAQLYLYTERILYSFNHGGQMAFITTAMTSAPAPLPTRKLITPGLVQQDGALSGVAIAFHALLAESWDLGGGHGNWAEIIYSGWGGLAGATSMRL